MTYRKTPDDLIERLIPIAESIEVIGIERTRHEIAEAYGDYAHYQTLRSEYAEVTRYTFANHADKIENITPPIQQLAGVISFVVNAGWRKWFKEDAEMTFGTWASTCKLLGEYLDWLEIYDLCDAMGYDVPDRDAFAGTIAEWDECLIQYGYGKWVQS